MTRPSIAFAEDALRYLVDESLVVGAASVTPVTVDPDDIVVNSKLGFVFKRVDTYNNAITATNDGGAGVSEELVLRCRPFVNDHHSSQIQAEHFLNQLEPAPKR